MLRAHAIFDNRQDAGRQLATKLMEYSDHSVVVLAIPNGGVPVGIEVASALRADLDVIICRKIPIPLNPEAGFGAIVDDGTVILNEELVRSLRLTRPEIEEEAAKVRAEIKRRNLLYQGERPLARVGGRTVIIVDDGLASGITMLAAVESVRRRHAKEIVAAAPCASESAIEQLKQRADKVVTCAIGSGSNFAVADYYRYWCDISDEEIVRYLNQWRAHHPWLSIESPQIR